MARKPDAKRDRIGVRVHERTRFDIERRHAVESHRPNPPRSLSETTELLIQYALREMPRGWRP